MNAKSIALVGVGLFTAIFVVIQVLTGGWNAISAFYKYLMVGAILSSFLAPRFGLVLLVFMSGYMDLLKRILVVGGQVSFNDLIYIVGLPPLCCVFVFLACLIKFAFGEEKRKSDVYRLIAVIGMTGLFGLGSILSAGANLGGIKTAAVGAGFIPLIFVVPFLYRDTADLVKLIKNLIIAFIPVAAYTFVQRFNGFTNFEVAYLMTGLSGESRILGGQDYRYFSTLNSSQNLSKVMGMFAILCILPIVRSEAKGRWLRSLIWGVAATIFASAAYYSGSRTGLVMALVFYVVFYVSRKRLLAISAYAGAVVLFFVILFSADYIANSDALGKAQSLIYSFTPLERDENRVFVLGTLRIRFVSLSEIANGNRLFPFGAKAAGKEELVYAYEVHDALSNALVQVGFVPLLVVGAFLVLILWKFHVTLWNGKFSGRGREVYALGFAYFCSVAVGSLSATANFQTYPITYFLYLFIGLSWAAFDGVRAKTLRNADKNEPESGNEIDVASGAMAATKS